MRKKISAALLAAAVAVTAPGATAVSAQQIQGAQVEVPKPAAGTYVKGEALVSMTTTQAAALTKEGDVSFDKHIEVAECWNFGRSEDASSGRVQDYVALLRSDIYTTEELMEIAARHYYVDAVAPNSYASVCAGTSDELSDYQWYLDGTDAISTASEGTHFADMPVTAANDAVVAVIDTGVDYTNEDLAASMWVNPYGAELAGTYGYDFANDDADPMDTQGHGSHCAGIIAAQKDNGKGIAGICDARIMALKVVADGQEKFETAGVIAAFEYVIKAQSLGVNIAAVNCSWGGGFDTGSVLERLINKIGKNGALTIFAAGNSGINWDAVAPMQRETPYDIDSPYKVIVGASDESDEVAGYSDYGNSAVDLFAPGSDILSTIHEARFLPQVWEHTKREQLTSYYNTVNGLDGLYTAAQIDGIDTPFTASLQYSGEVGYQDNANGSLRFCVRRNSAASARHVTESDRENAAFIYLDVTDMHMDTSATYHISCLMSEDYGDEKHDWFSVEKISSPQDSRFVTAGGRTYLALIGLNNKTTKDTTCYVDNLAVSVANPDTAQFGKYDLMSGTSMAAPMVTAAAAILTSANPSVPAEKIRAQLLKCVRTVDAVENACTTGGILDLSGLSVLATRLTLNRTSATVRYGRTLQLAAKVAPSNATNARVRWRCSNSRYALVTSGGLVKIKKAGIGKTITVTAVTADGSGLKKTCKIKILSAKRK